MQPVIWFEHGNLTGETRPGRIAERSGDATSRFTAPGTAAWGLFTCFTPRVRQALVLAGAVLAYFGVRGVTEGKRELALRNADYLMRVERFLHLDWEESVQQFIVGSSTATAVLNWIYIYGHWPVIVATLLWLALRHPAVFLRARNAMLASGAVGLVVFVTVPVAPPRLAGLDVQDTITLYSNSYRILQPTGFTNQYAALPSLHAGWNLVMALAIAAAAGHRVLRLLAVVMTVSMDVAVVLTANHYVIDVIAGAALSAGAWFAVDRSWRRRDGQDTEGVRDLGNRPSGWVAVPPASTCLPRSAPSRPRWTRWRSDCSTGMPGTACAKTPATDAPTR